MSTYFDASFERTVAAWLADGPSELAEGVLDDALRGVHLTRQRRRAAMLWRTLAMTIHPTSSLARAMTAVVVVAIAAGGTIYVLAPRWGAGPAASPSPTPLVTAAPSPGRTAQWISLSGRITDAAGRPVVAVVSVATGAAPYGDGGETTKADGTWTIGWLGVTGPYCVDAKVTLPDLGGTTWALPVDSSWQHPSATRTCEGTSSAPIDLVLPTYVLVSGTVVDANGNVIHPAGEVRVSMNALSTTASLTAHGTVDKTGTFLISLPQGTWRLWGMGSRGHHGTYGNLQDVTVGNAPVTGIVMRVDVPDASPSPSAR